MDGGDRRVPGWSKVTHPAEESVGIEPGRGDYSRPCRQGGQNPRDQAMRMEQWQRLQQAIRGPSAKAAPAL